MVTRRKPKLTRCSAQQLIYESSRLTLVIPASPQDFMLILVNLFKIKQATFRSKTGPHSSSSSSFMVRFTCYSLCTHYTVCTRIVERIKGELKWLSVARLPFNTFNKSSRSETRKAETNFPTGKCIANLLTVFVCIHIDYVHHVVMSYGSSSEIVK